MLFNSYIFIFAFLPIVFTGYYFLRLLKFFNLSKCWLIFASLFFYSWWNILYLPLLIFSITVNYFIGMKINKTIGSNRKKILLFGIVFNISLLGFFKYYDFFIGNLNFVFSSNFDMLNIVLPLGISFITFQKIGYLVDTYRGETDKYSFLDFGMFVTFFPQLIAGPIVMHSELIPQLKEQKNSKVFNLENICKGICIFTIGLFKKVILADEFGTWANSGFDSNKVLSFLDAWITSLSYTMQIYFDFSGYSEMAIGLALLFNIKLPINFNSPYSATSIIDFWKRWHMTLTRFLTHYIYFPLGGSRRGVYRTFLNVFIVFLISGLWHGAGWTFILWGGLHGLASIINRVFKILKLKINKVVGWFLTFNFVNITWVFFRATQWEDAVRVIKGMFGMNGFYIDLPSFNLQHQVLLFLLPSSELDMINFIIFLIVALVFILLEKSSSVMFQGSESLLSTKKIVIIGIILSYTLMSLNKMTEFLYFNF